MDETLTTVPPEFLFWKRISRNSSGSVIIGVTCKGSSADRDLRSRVCYTAVSCGDNGVGVEEGATAEVRATNLQGDDEGEVSSRCSLSADDVDT